jgi:hypothetical protein
LAHIDKLGANRSHRYASGIEADDMPASTVLTPTEKNGWPQGVSSTGPAAVLPMDQREDGALRKSVQAKALEAGAVSARIIRLKLPARNIPLNTIVPFPHVEHTTLTLFDNVPF